MSFAHSNGILSGAVAACFGLLVGCSSSSTPGGGTGDGGGTTPTAATFTEVYTTIISFNSTCSAHHSGANPSGALDMSTQSNAYKNLVGVKAAGPLCGSSGETRVVAGNHAASLLYMKVAGTETCGVQMPDGETPISSADVALIQSWIDDGALNN